MTEVPAKDASQFSSTIIISALGGACPNTYVRSSCIFFTQQGTEAAWDNRNLKRILCLRTQHDLKPQSTRYYHQQQKNNKLTKLKASLASQKKSTNNEHLFALPSTWYNIVSFLEFFWFYLAPVYFPASGEAVVSGVVPLPPWYVPSILIAHGVQHSHRSSIFIEC